MTAKEYLKYVNYFGNSVSEDERKFQIKTYVKLIQTELADKNVLASVMARSTIAGNFRNDEIVVRVSDVTDLLAAQKEQNKRKYRELSNNWIKHLKLISDLDEQ